MNKSPTLGPGQAGHHGVRFYDDSIALCGSVADFLGDGLAAGQPAVMIARPHHRKLVTDDLLQRGFRVADLIEREDLCVHDAQSMLDSFMVGHEPHAARFGHAMRGIMAPLSKRGNECSTVRAYGEMVDVLWAEGHRHGAIRLELLWNKLMSECAFSLLCGYSMGPFYKQATDLKQVCDLHTHHHVPDRPAA